MPSASPKHDNPPAGESTEQSLRAEIAELRRQLEQQKALSHPSPPHARTASRPSRTSLWALALLTVVLIVGGFVAGYIPHQRRESVLLAEAEAASQSLPSVNVTNVERSSAQVELVLPGSMQAITETPVLARASGYVKRRLADIGDHVDAGQLLAEIESPELDQQVRQAGAALEQARSAQEQAAANLRQGRTNEHLAQITAQRWSNLVAKGVVSRQENDTYQARREAEAASVQALEKAVAASRSNVAAAEANLARLNDLQNYRNVRAPFAGVITLRNVDAGTLITEGSTMLFRIAQTARLRTYVNVPQGDAASIHVGQQAALLIPEMPGRRFPGTVTRTASALDPATRTMLTEVQVANPDGRLLPGTYAQVSLIAARQNPPLLIPGDTLVVRSNGPQVAVVGPSQQVHYQLVQVGRDFGDRIEVLSGLQAGQQVVVNPGDSVREGIKVNVVALGKKAAP